MIYDTGKIRICIIDDDQTVKYAGLELKYYIERMTAGKLLVELCYEAKCFLLNEGKLYLGKQSSFEQLEGYISIALPQVADTQLDDAFNIRVSEGEGFICGTNPRSVLLGVYRFLTEMGCRWVRPGKDGESVPYREKSDLNAKIIENASYRHRGICIEGAVSYENVADMIDWMPKVGFNSYMIQFREAYNFFNKWYTHEKNPLKESEAFTVERAREFCIRLRKEIKKRGLVNHAVGHGWTCEPFGIEGLDWEPKEYNLPDKILNYLAQVNGKRQIWQNVALNTNLCYSDSNVRKKVVENVLEYLNEHNETDVLHFWLADSYNNHCECEECQKMIPTDYYVKMLNELDEILTLNGINTKIVFLIYFELLWPPQKEVIQNPDRFILMFAPITRDYGTALSGDTGVTELTYYERNRIIPPKTIQENIYFLKAWQQVFKGESFDFDYHMMWEHMRDPGYYRIARILSMDIKNLKELGLNGFISCQLQRAFLPTGLPMYIMGKTLWDSSLDFEDIAAEYFEAAFGDEGEHCREYLSTLSELFDHPYFMSQQIKADEEFITRLQRIQKVISDFSPVIDKNIKALEICKAKSWSYLKFHASIYKRLADMLYARAINDKKAADSCRNNLLQFLWENEDEIQAVFDLYNFVMILSRI